MLLELFFFSRLYINRASFHRQQNDIVKIIRRNFPIMRPFCYIYFTALNMLAALAQDFGDMEEFYYDVSNYPIAYDAGTLRDMEIEEQITGDNALFLTDEKVDAATSTDLTLLGSWSMLDEPAVPSQDFFASWIDGDSIDGWNDIATASTPLDTYAPTSDPYDSSGPVDTGHLIAISPLNIWETY
jgi:hypothetical protein